jgi:hypothetical protein
MFEPGWADKLGRDLGTVDRKGKAGPPRQMQERKLKRSADEIAERKRPVGRWTARLDETPPELFR